MEAKLTLKLDKDVIEEARIYAKNKNISLSRMVEKYFKSVTNKMVNTKKNKKYSPLIEELSGIISLDEDYNLKDDYTNYLVEKYQ